MEEKRWLDLVEKSLGLSSKLIYLNAEVDVIAQALEGIDSPQFDFKLYFEHEKDWGSIPNIIKKVSDTDSKIKLNKEVEKLLKTMLESYKKEIEKTQDELSSVTKEIATRSFSSK